MREPGRPRQSAIRIELGPDPRSRGSDLADSILIESDASRLLLEELRRYCDGRVNGRSFLIAGHRGSGKTTLVEGAYQKLLRESLQTDSDTMLRPLFVPLHGPNLIPASSPFVPDEEVEDLAEDEDGLELELDEAELEEELELDEEAEDAEPESEEPPAEQGLREALIQITIALYTALAREMSRAYRRNMHERAEAARAATFTGFRAREPVGSEHALERAARLAYELDGFPEPARLREYWRRGGFLETGVLFDSGQRPLDQGYLELLALTSANRLYQRVSGTFSSKETQRRQAEALRQRQLGAGDEGTGTDLVTPIASLLTGGAVGAGAGAAAGTWTGILAGLVGALGAVGVFKASSTRKRSRTLDVERIFEADLSLATLDRELPKLIGRLNDCGLAPIFVVDELDKIDQLSDAITEMVRRLKKFVAEQACFCFLTDRGYFETIRRKSLAEAYPKEYTYFTHQIFVVFRPADLHGYLERVLALPGDSPSTSDEDEAPAVSAAQIRDSRDVSEDRSDYPLLPYILKHRAFMHPIDMRRLLSSLRTDRGTLALRPGLVRTSLGFRFDLMIQIAIEVVLDEKNLAAVLERRPEFRRMAHDALYYPSREWARGGSTVLDLSETGADAFEAYMIARISLEKSVNGDQAAGNGGNAAQSADSLSPRVKRQLLAMVRRLCRLLADPQQLRAEMETWRELDPSIYNALPSEPPLLETQAEHVYEWRFDPAGIPIGRAEAETAPTPGGEGEEDAPWLGTIRRIQEIAGLLAESTEAAVDFTTLSTQMGVLPDSPGWPEVEYAIERLRDFSDFGEDYPEFENDRNTVAEFEALVEEYARCLALAFAAGAAIGSVSSENGFGARTVVGIGAIAALHNLHGLRGSSEKTARLESIWSDLASRFEIADLPQPPAGFDLDAWEAWFSGLQDLEVPATYPNDLRQRGWRVWERERLGRYLEGERTFEPTLDELLGFAADQRPANLLRPNLDDMTLRSWSKVFLWSVNDVTPRHRFFCPAWAAAVAASELGWGGVLAGEARNLLASGASRLRSQSLTGEARSRIEQVLRLSEVSSEAMPTSLRPPTILIRATLQSVTHGWAPSHELPALCLKASEFAGLPDPWRTFLQRGRRQPIIEVPFDPKIKRLTPGRPIFIAREQPKERLPGPVIVNPTSLEDLLLSGALKLPVKSS